MNALPQAQSFATRTGVIEVAPRLTHRALSAGIYFLLALLVAFSTSTVHSQASRAGLVRQAVDESSRITLTGNTHPLATSAADRGPVDPSMTAERMLLVLKRSTEQELAFRAMVESLHDANSPNFHKWLTPEQFGAQWGAADSDIAAVTAWLQSHGFQVKGPSVGKTVIEFSGTAAQVQEAFHTSIHTFEVNGEIHHANASDPQIPAALAPVVAGIKSLNDFRPKSMAKKGPRGTIDLSGKSIRMDNGLGAKAIPHPNLTVLSSGADVLFVGPSDAATIYNAPNKALNPAYTGSTIDGTGAKIAILGDSNISVQQALNYRKLFGLSARAPYVVIDGGTDPGVNSDAVEAYLDVEVANALAPNATVYLYTAANTSVSYGLDLATVRAVNDNIADVINISFGACEAGLGTAGNQFYEAVWAQAAAQGMSVTVSSGDAGSAGCDDPNTQTIAYYGVQVNGIGSTAFNIAVGGTDFSSLAGPDGSGADFNKYVSSKNASGTLRSALGYIPESPWNDSAAVYPPSSLAGNLPFPSPYANIVAAGGGRSNCAKGGVDSNGNILCTAGYPKPSWQSGVGVPADKLRDVPDVSLLAANGLDYVTWGICTDQDADANGNPVTDCVPGSGGVPAYIYGVGGTSASSPAFAGILALVRQATGERQGQADYVLYHLAQKVPTIFHDVTIGNNSVACEPGTHGCIKDTAGAHFEGGYDATVGYDLASGLGSVDIASLVSNWSSAGLKTSTTTLTVTPTSIQHGTPVTADITVAGNGANASGNVALFSLANPPSVPLGEAIGTYTLRAGGTTGNLTLNSLPGGKYDLEASFGGSTTLQSSVSAPVAVSISPEPSITNVSDIYVNPSNGNQGPAAEVHYGFPLYFTATPYGKNSPVVGGVVQPDGIATGRVAFLAGKDNLGAFTLGLNGQAVTGATFFVPGAYTVTATYHGDNSFDPSTGFKQVRIVKAQTKLTLTSSSKTYVGKPIAFTIALSTDSAGLAPTGNVELVSKGIVLAHAKLNGTAGSSKGVAIGDAIIETAELPPGENEINAVYLGDTNYEKSGSFSLLIKGRPTFAIKPSHIGLPGQHTTAAAYVTIVSEGGYGGTIKLTCKLISKTTAAHPPQCAMDPGSVTLAANGTVTPQILIFGKGTKLPPGVTAENKPGSGMGLGLGTGGVALACCLLFGIPARRKAWRSMLSVLLLMIAIAGFSGCGSTPKIISAGVYEFQVTGTDSQDPTLTATGTVRVVVL